MEIDAKGEFKLALVKKKRIKLWFVCDFEDEGFREAKEERMCALFESALNSNSNNASMGKVAELEEENALLKERINSMFLLFQK